MEQQLARVLTELNQKVDQLMLDKQQTKLTIQQIMNERQPCGKEIQDSHIVDRTAPTDLIFSEKLLELNPFEHSKAGIQNPIQGESSINNALGTLQKEGGQRSSNTNGKRSSSIAYKKGDRKSEIKLISFLKSDFLNSEENRWAKTGFGPKRNKQVRTGKEEGLYDLPEFIRCIYARSNTQTIKEVPEVRLEWKELSIQEHKYSNGDVFGLPPYIGEIEINMRRKYFKDTQKAKGTGLQNQNGEVADDSNTINMSSRYENQLKGYEIKSSHLKDQGFEERSKQASKIWGINHKRTGKLYWESTSHVSGSASGKINASSTFRVEKQIASGKEIMVSNCSSNTISNLESTVLERQLKKVEWAPLYTRNSGERDFHRCKQCRMGLCEEVWRNNFSRAFEDSRRYLEILLNYKHTATCVIHFNFYKPSRCAKQAHSTDRVVYINKNVQSNRADPGFTRYRSVCSSKEQEVKKLLQLVQGPTRSGPKRLGKGMEILGKPVLLSALEPNPTNNSEGSKREDYSHPNNPGLEICNMVSRRGNAFFNKPSYNLSVGNSARPEKRKVPPDGEQSLKPDSLED
ncbi:hypothetical protein BB560_004166 [Smittium megazygosporum]|uniref:Uncharacterized protein n=1 Tax=Smittium megazygosporum TaxID=133381 RepID=A0A2T9ZA26_9FUNG|nr:hypothetical protein BB560_004166 [Smittium megazygosporum]